MRRLLAAIAISTVAAGGAYAETSGSGGSTGAGSSKSMGQQSQGALSGQKLTQAECETMWKQANPNNAASISESEAQSFITDVKSINPDQDGTIERSEFMNACDRGLVKSTATTGAGAGESGSTRAPSQKQQQEQRPYR